MKRICFQYLCSHTLIGQVDCLIKKKYFMIYHYYRPHTIIHSLGVEWGIQNNAWWYSRQRWLWYHECLADLGLNRNIPTCRFDTVCAIFSTIRLCFSKILNLFIVDYVFIYLLIFLDHTQRPQWQKKLYTDYKHSEQLTWKPVRWECYSWRQRSWNLPFSLPRHRSCLWRSFNSLAKLQNEQLA
jgi:hypothetical protein